MKLKVILLIFFLSINSLYSQTDFTNLELEYSHSIKIGASFSILFHYSIESDDSMTMVYQKDEEVIWRKEVSKKKFKEICDAALKIIAQRLRNHLPADDFIARIGGDEFVILCYDVDTAENAVKIAERLLEAIKEEMVLNGYTRQMSASIGIALMPQHGRTVTELLTLADKAMYQAKRKTKGSVVLADLSV